MDYHHHQVQLHCRVCAKRMYDRRGVKKDTAYQCEAYTEALHKVFGVAFQTEEDAMVYPQSFCSSCKRSLQKAMDAAAQGVPYRCCVTAFQWQAHKIESCMVRCFTPNMMACVLISSTHIKVCEHFTSTQQVGRPSKVIHPAKERSANKLLKYIDSISPLPLLMLVATQITV